MIRRSALWVGLLAVVVAIDQLTKLWAGQQFQEAPQVIIPGVLEFTYGENTGAAWSMFSGGGSIIGVVALIVVVVIVVLLFRRRSAAEATALALIGGGAAGNLADRIFRGPGLLDGPVVDWIRLTFVDFPVFNVADMSITFAVVVILVSALRSR